VTLEDVGGPAVAVAVAACVRYCRPVIAAVAIRIVQHGTDRPTLAEIAAAIQTAQGPATGFTPQTVCSPRASSTCAVARMDHRAETGASCRRATHMGASGLGRVLVRTAWAVASRVARSRRNLFSWGNGRDWSRGTSVN